MIPFNKPFLTGNELDYIRDSVNSGKISGNGQFTKRCHSYFEETFGFKKCLLTSSCTDALEMAAILLDISPGDEVIMPSYTFVSTANAFVLRGAKIVFADSRPDHPGIDESALESLINSRTRAIVVVHYAGVACHMDLVMSVARKHGLFVVEDAAQAIDSYYYSNGVRKALGSLGHMAAFSFHETKNIISGEGGMLVVNDDRFFSRAEIIWEKGPNRSAFFRGEVDKYGWVDIGSSFLPSDILAAFLFAQVECLEQIQTRRKNIWEFYFTSLADFTKKNDISLQSFPDFATNNAHMFYLVCPSLDVRNLLIDNLRKHRVLAVFHYQSLHKSAFYSDFHDGRDLPEADRYTDCLFRLPLFYELSRNQQEQIVSVLVESL